jgi:hypothetical protein
MPRLFGAAAMEARTMRIFIFKSVFTALLLTSAAAAQTQTPAEPPAIEPAPEAAPAAGVESAAPVDWAVRAREAFAANFKETCASQEGEPPISERQAEFTELKFNDTLDAPDDPERTAGLYRFFCSRGAYNESHVFYLHNGEYLTLVGFAEPHIHVDYENEDSDGKVLGIRVTGLRARNVMANSSVDAKTLTVSSADKWRGAADASSSGTWLFKDGEFVLSTFEVDASYDGKINPVMVADYRAENEALGETP